MPGYFLAPPIFQHLSPRIAIFAVPEVTQSCQANGLSGVDELFKPWQDQVERVSILSSTLTPTVFPTYPLRFTSYEALERSQSGGGGYVPYSAETVVDVVSNLVGKLDPTQEKQYDVLRDTLLAAGPINEHETFNHPVCFILATSSASPDPLGSLQRLHQLSASSPAYSARPFMDNSNNSVMRFWLVVHDVMRDGPNLLKAQQILALVKKTFGPHAALLVINSAPPISFSEGDSPIPTPPFHEAYSQALSDISRNDPFKNLTQVLAEDISLEVSSSKICARLQPPSAELYARHLREEDILAIRLFLRELTTQSIVPWMEARVREWTEIYSNSRRGITGRLFGAGKKFFGGGTKSVASSGGSGYNSIRGYYPPSSPEAICRRLADFAFMLRDYRFSAGIYDGIRRDYAQDGATKLAASATEMHGVASLADLATRDFGQTRMQQQQRQMALSDIESWLEQAVAGYRSVKSIQLDGLRATLLYLEAWRAWSQVDRDWQWNGVSKGLVRCAEELEEVPSAILLEQAANFDLKSGKYGVRKHAAHLVMAARRYERSGQRALSARCLERALGYYRDQTPPWVHAQDYIEYGLGRQAYTLGKSSLAVEHFAKLLQRGNEAEDQSGVLQNFVLAYQQLRAKPDGGDNCQIELPSPIFGITGTRIEIPSDDSDCGLSDASWREMEEIILKAGFSDEKAHRPSALLSSGSEVQVKVDEPFNVHLTATNPLNTAVNLESITLIATHTDGTPIEEQTLEVHAIDSVQLEPSETREITIEAILRNPETVRISQVQYVFHNTFTAQQNLKRRGRRRFDTKQARLTPMYAEDTTLDIIGRSQMPSLKVVPSYTSCELLAGEVTELSVQLVNTGRVAIDRVELLVNPAGWIELESAAIIAEQDSNALYLPGPIIVHKGEIDPGNEVTVKLTLQGSQIGLMDLPMMFACRSSGERSTFSVTRKSLSISILPGPAFDPTSARTIMETLDSCFVKVQLRNDAELTDITIDSLDAIGPFWKWSPSSSMYGNRKSELESRSLGCVGPNQIWTTVGILESITNDVEPSVRYTVDGLRRVIAGAPVSKDYPPTLLLPSSSPPASEVTSPSPSPQWYKSARNISRLSTLSAQYPLIPVSDLCHIFPLHGPERDVDLVVRWSIDNESDGGLDSATTGEGQERGLGLRLGRKRHGVTILHGFEPTVRQSFLDDLSNRDPPSSSSASSSSSLPLAASQISISRKPNDGSTKLAPATNGGGGAGTSGRVMYEETTRTRAALMKSITAGPLSIEENPVRIKWTVLALTDDAEAEAQFENQRRRKIKHNFDKSPFITPAQVTIQNISFRYPITYDLVLDTPSSSTEPFNPNLSFLGLRRFQGFLPPRSAKSHTFKLAVNEPGSVFGVEGYRDWSVRVSIMKSAETKNAQTKIKAVGVKEATEHEAEEVDVDVEVEEQEQEQEINEPELDKEQHQQQRISFTLLGHDQAHYQTSVVHERSRGLSTARGSVLAIEQDPAAST